MSRTARCTMILVIANVAVYLIVFGCWLISGNNPEAVNRLSNILALPAPFCSFISRPWTIITFTITQVDIIHLITNLLWLLGFGAMMKSGPRALLGVYLLGGMLGGNAYMAYAASVGGAMPPLIGASSSVIAIVIATTILTPNRHVGLLWFWEIKLKWLAPIALLTLFCGSTGSLCAHLGGVVAGVASGFALRQIDKLRTQRSLMKARLEIDRLKQEARRSAIIAKAGTSGFASLSEAERLEMFNLSRAASGE